MREIFHKIGAIAMAVLVLFATMSLSLDMHFCGKTLVDLKFYQQADTCGMEMAGMDMTSDSSESHCCSDVAVVIPGQDDLQFSVDTLTLDQQAFLVSFAYTYLQLIPFPEKEHDPFRDYAPPPLIRDIQVLDQTFLI